MVDFHNIILVLKNPHSCFYTTCITARSRYRCGVSRDMYDVVHWCDLAVCTRHQLDVSIVLEMVSNGLHNNVLALLASYDYSIFIFKVVFYFIMKSLSLIMFNFLPKRCIQ